MRFSSDIAGTARCLWRTLLRFIHVAYLALVACLLFAPTVPEWLLYVCGAAGVLLWVHVFYIAFMRPFKFDQFVANSGLLKLFRVAATVIAVPVMLTCAIVECNVRNQCAGTGIHAIDMIYEDGLYGDSTAVAAHRAEERCQHEKPDLLWTVVYLFVDPGNQHMATTRQARKLSLALALCGVVLLGGLLLTTLINWIDQRAKDFELGLRRYNNCVGWPSFLRPFFRRRVVIFMGAHPMLESIIKQYLSAESEGGCRIDHFLVLTTANVAELHTHLRAVMTDKEYTRVLVYSGYRGEAEEIRKLPFYAAHAVYILGERDESNHDSINILAMDLMRERMKDGRLELRGHTPCHVLFDYQTTFSIMQTSDIDSIIQQNAEDDSKIEFVAYNYYELWAQQVFVNRDRESNREPLYCPLEGFKPMRADDDEYVHLVIVGMSKMGVAMAMQAARICHYPNFRMDDANRPQRKNRTRITFIDKHADEELGFFASHYKALIELSRWRYFEPADPMNKTSYYAPTTIDDSAKWNDRIAEEGSPFHYLCLGDDGKADDSNFVDVEWQFIKGGVEMAAVQNYLGEEASRSRMTVAVCLPNISESTAAALYLPEPVFVKAESILVYQKGADNLLRSVMPTNGAHSNRYEKIRPFGMMEKCKMQITHLELAKYMACVYSIRCRLKDAGREITYAVLRDELRKANVEEAWIGQKMWARWSNIYNAQCVASKLHSYGASLNMSESELKTILGINDNTTDSDEAADADKPYIRLAQVEHNRWNVEKMMLGFRPMTADEKRIEAEEAKRCAEGKGSSEDLQKKKAVWKKQFVHVNICSSEKLRRLDIYSPDIFRFDVAYSLAIPAIVGIINEQKH